MSSSQPGDQPDAPERPDRRDPAAILAPAAAVIALALGALIAIALLLGALRPAGAEPTPGPSASAAPGPTATPEPTPAPTPTPSPTPEPTPTTVPAPLTGLPVLEELAARPVLAVMIDDQRDARPQSGLGEAGIVWHAPAEGGIPRYMALFQDGDPAAVGPVRSSRLYYIGWAAEWNAVYVHVGGSPQALAYLRTAAGRGGEVWNADEFTWGPTYLWRIRERFAPHNVYSSGEKLRELAAKVGATPAPRTPAWTFAPGAPAWTRPAGASVEVRYLANRIAYAYEWASNRWVRTVTGGAGAGVDAATGERLAPANVVVLVVPFAPLDDGSKKNRLEADLVGEGRAWIATNGRIVAGTWRKGAFDAPTLLFGPDGSPAVLTAGQTFVQVVPAPSMVTVTAGGATPSPPRPAAGGRPDPAGPLAD